MVPLDGSTRECKFTPGEKRWFDSPRTNQWRGK